MSMINAQRGVQIQQSPRENASHDITAISGIYVAVFSAQFAFEYSPIPCSQPALHHPPPAARMSTSASLFESFLGGLEASLSVLLTLGYGVAAARFGLIGPTAMKDASRLCNKLFLPALLIVNVGSQLSVSNLDKYWPVLGQSDDDMLRAAHC